MSVDVQVMLAAVMIWLLSAFLVVRVLFPAADNPGRCWRCREWLNWRDADNICVYCGLMTQEAAPKEGNSQGDAEMKNAPCD